MLVHVLYITYTPNAILCQYINLGPGQKKTPPRGGAVSLLIDLSAMSNLDHGNNQYVILELADNPVVTDAVAPKT